MNIFDAIKAGDAAAVSAALDADPSLVNTKNEGGLSAFTFAKYNRKDEIARLLLERGAVLDAFAACMIGDFDRLKSALNSDPGQASAFSHDGWTALHLAAFFGHLECARLLVEAGAPINERSKNQMENFPIHAAVAGRKADVVALLIDHGAAVNARQHGGWTPLHGAAQNGDNSIALLLIASGADTTARAGNNQNALDLAMLKGHQDMVDILEDHGGSK